MVRRRLIRVLQEYDQQNSCEVLDRLGELGATITRHNPTEHVFEIEFSAEDGTIIQADLSVFRTDGRVELLSMLSFAQFFPDSADAPSPSLFPGRLNGSLPQ